MVGFGKAVLDMAVQLHAVVGSAITSGVLSIPHGVLPGTVLTDEFLRTFKIHEGAANNIPDEDSLRATSIIMELVSTLSSDDILLILISGSWVFQIFVHTVALLQFNVELLFTEM